MPAMKSVEWVVLALFLALLWLKVRARRQRTGPTDAEKFGISRPQDPKA
jgi:hypothetical protein